MSYLYLIHLHNHSGLVQKVLEEKNALSMPKFLHKVSAACKNYLTRDEYNHVA